MSSFDRDFGERNFEPVERTVLIDDVAAQLLDRRPPGDPELAKEYRLLVVDPTGQEWEYPIRGEILLGRSEENQIMLEDRAVSRHHLAINTDGKLFWFKDLDSGNGTQLGGEFVHEGWLTGGEEIIIGNSRIYFLIPDVDVPPEDLHYGDEPHPEDHHHDDQPAQSTEHPPKALEKEEGSKWLLLTLIVVVLGFGVAGLGAWVLIKKMRAPNIEPQENPVQMALQKLTEGNKFMAQRRWKEANSVFRSAASSVPAGNPLRSTLLEKASQAEKEDTALRIFKAAEKLYFRADKGCQAYKQLNSIPKDTEANEDARKLKTRIFNKEIKQELRVVDLLIASGKKDQARQALAKILLCDPQLPQAISRQKALEEPTPAPAPIKRPTPTPRRRNISRRASGSFSTGIELFCQGRYAQAVVHFSRMASSGSRSVRRKARRYRKHVQTFRRSVNSSSASSLLRAHSASRALRGCGRSRYTSKLARALYNRGKRSQSRKRYASAYRDFKRALSFNSSMSAARSAIRKLQKKAKSLYQQALVLMDVDSSEARKMLRQVVSMLPSSDPIYRKAKSKL